MTAKVDEQIQRMNDAAVAREQRGFSSLAVGNVRTYILCDAKGYSSSQFHDPNTAYCFRAEADWGTAYIQRIG